MEETIIQKVFGRRVWDSRGRPTVEAQVCTMGGAVGRAIAPAGASTGSGEAVDLRDGGARLGGYGVELAVNQVNSAIAQSLRGLDSADQLKVDQTLIQLDGTHKQESTRRKRYDRRLHGSGQGRSGHAWGTPLPLSWRR